MSIVLPPELKDADREIIEAFLSIIGRESPSLKDIWLCIDFVWDQVGCENRNIDNVKLQAFYDHPVWLLNGLFIEQHEESISHRRVMADWISDKSPVRVADYGGGFGLLARFIAESCPSTEVHVIEPTKNHMAVDYSKDFENVSFETWFTGDYDIIIATDVFEHIQDPLKYVEKSSSYLKKDGYYLMANCFYPVVKCHLPETFHFRYTWTTMLEKMNLNMIESVAYGHAYIKSGDVRVKPARRIESLSHMVHSLMNNKMIQVDSPLFYKAMQYIYKFM